MTGQIVPIPLLCRALRFSPRSERDRFAVYMKELTEYASRETGFIDEKQLLARLPVSRRTLANWRKQGRIPFVQLPGARRVLYHWQSVEASLLRMQRNGAL